MIDGRGVASTNWAIRLVAIRFVGREVSPDKRLLSLAGKAKLQSTALEGIVAVRPAVKHNHPRILDRPGFHACRRPSQVAAQACANLRRFRAPVN